MDIEVVRPGTRACTDMRLGLYKALVRFWTMGGDAQLGNADLPRDVVNIIVGFAEVDIDTRRSFGVYRRLNVDEEQRDLLATVNCKKRELIVTGDATVCRYRYSRGCKHKDTFIRVNRYTGMHDMYVLVKCTYKT